MKWEEMPHEDKVQGCATILLLMGVLGLCATVWGWAGFWCGITAYALLVIVMSNLGSKP